MFKKSFIFLWLGQSFANLGDVFYIVSVISLLYSLTDSAFYTAFVPFSITIARFLGGLFLPLVVNRLKLKFLLIISQGAKTFLLLLLFLCFSTVHFDTSNTVSFVFLLISGIAYLDGWAVPVRQSLVVNLVQKDQLMKTNSFLSITDQVLHFSGWPLGALIVAHFSGMKLLLITLALFAMSVFFMMFISVQEKKRIHSSEDHGDSMLKGWRALWTKPSLRLATFLEILDTLASVVWIAAILYVYVDETLHKSEAWWGYINSSFFAGLLIGGLICLKNKQLLSLFPQRILFLSSITIAIFTILFGFTSNEWIALGCSVAVGVFSQFHLILITTIFQIETDEELIPNVFSARDAVMTGLFGVGTLFYGVLADWLPIVYAFVLSVCFLCLYSLLVVTHGHVFNKGKTFSKS
ncbi:MFS transporter [Bacillus weihaiensis]|uniref:MFS transporter n=1 Tax=Bacillus weihaiensis TaxID=1547283 RepID=UPI002354C223|nr:MFS transporter [Bacillus weihaiensis]